MGVVYSKVLFQPPSPPTYTTKKFEDKIEMVSSSNYDIPVVFNKCKKEKTKTTIIYSHGNGSDLGSIGNIERLGEMLKVNICVYDYSGYGISEFMRGSDSSSIVNPGLISEKMIYSDIEAVLNYLKSRHSIPYTEIIVFGASLGGAPSIYIASKYKLKGLIVQSTFASVLNIVGMKGWTGIDTFKNYALIENVKCKTFILHGENDNIVNVSNGKLLEDILKEKNGEHYGEVLYIKKAKHNDLVDVMGTERWIKTLEKWINKM